jgi:hypothetical protein
MRFAEFQACFPQLRRAYGNENVSLVVFQFGPLVRGNRVFQRQRMQAEFLAQAGDGLAVRRFQFNPDETIRFFDVVTDVVEFDGLGFGIGKEKAVDDGLQLRGARCCDFSSRYPCGSILERLAHNRAAAATWGRDLYGISCCAGRCRWNDPSGSHTA